MIKKSTNIKEGLISNDRMYLCLYNNNNLLKLKLFQRFGQYYKL